MKEAGFVIPEWQQLMRVPIKKNGRPLGGKKRARPTLERLPNNFYSTIAGLKDTDIDAFLAVHMNIGVVYGPHKGHLAIKQDIIDFQEELSFINAGSDVINDYAKRNVGFTDSAIKKAVKMKTKSQQSFFETLNKYLDDCRISFQFPPMIRQTPTKEEVRAYKKELDEIESGENPSGFLKSSLLVGGRNIKWLFCDCPNIFCWCVLNMVVDKLFKDKPVYNCSRCDRIFIPKRKQQRYCNVCTPQERAADRASKARKKK